MAYVNCKRGFGMCEEPIERPDPGPLLRADEDPTPLTGVFVYNEKRADFVHTQARYVKCTDCGCSVKESGLGTNDPESFWWDCIAGEWYLICGTCGEQFAVELR